MKPCSFWEPGARKATGTASAAPNRRSECEMHDPTGEPDAGNPHVPVPSQTSLQSPENPAVEAVRTPSPYLYPSGKPALGCPRNTPEKAPSLDEDPLQPLNLNFNSVTRPPSAAMDLRSSQGDRHAPESVIGLSELVIGIVGIRSKMSTPLYIV